MKSVSPPPVDQKNANIFWGRDSLGRTEKNNGEVPREDSSVLLGNPERKRGGVAASEDDGKREEIFFRGIERVQEEYWPEERRCDCK